MSRPTPERRWWSATEDAVLLQEAQVDRTGSVSKWNEVAALLPSRTNKDCRKRWYKIRYGIKKGPWTSLEDEQLQQAVAKEGLKWSAVARIMQTRNADQCAKRWQHVLDPAFKHLPWTDEEDQILQNAVSEHGHNWQQICRSELPERSTHDIRNRYVSLSRRHQRETEDIHKQQATHSDASQGNVAESLISAEVISKDSASASTVNAAETLDADDCVNILVDRQCNSLSLISDNTFMNPILPDDPLEGDLEPYHPFDIIALESIDLLDGTDIDPSLLDNLVTVNGSTNTPSSNSTFSTPNAENSALYYPNSGSVNEIDYLEEHMDYDFTNKALTPISTFSSKAKPNFCINPSAESDYEFFLGDSASLPTEDVMDMIPSATYQANQRFAHGFAPDSSEVRTRPGQGSDATAGNVTILLKQCDSHLAQEVLGNLGRIDADVTIRILRD